MKNRVAYFGVFVALAFIFSYIETLLPVPIGIPGVKLGLANLVIVIALYKMGTKFSLPLTVARVILAGFMFGSMFSMLYSLGGALVSFAAMVFLKSRDGFSVMGVSIVGGVFHNIGQLIVAMFVVETARLLYYGPILLISGVCTGFLIGIVSKEVLKRLPDFGIQK